MNLGASEALGIVKQNGSVAWRASGMYECGGALSFLVAPILCRFTGTLHRASMSAKPTVHGVTLSFEGLDPQSGAVTWHVPVLNALTFATGSAIPFLDEFDVVARGPHGEEVVNLRNGRTRAAGSTTYWCEHVTIYRIISYPGDYRERTRAAFRRASRRRLE